MRSRIQSFSRRDSRLLELRVKPLEEGFTHFSTPRSSSEMQCNNPALARHKSHSQQRLTAPALFGERTAAKSCHK